MDEMAKIYSTESGDQAPGLDWTVSPDALRAIAEIESRAIMCWPFTAPALPASR